jgi:ribosomal protein L32
MRDETTEPLIAVHVCKVCGTATERSAVNPDNTITGLVKCPSCGHEGDLNIEIRGKSTMRPPVSAAAPRTDS